MAACAIAKSLGFTFKLSPPAVPTCINVSAPTSISSSTAIEAEGPPIPVEVTDTSTFLYLPVAVTYSL